MLEALVVLVVSEPTLHKVSQALWPTQLRLVQVVVAAVLVAMAAKATTLPSLDQDLQLIHQLAAVQVTAAARVVTVVQQVVVTHQVAMKAVTHQLKVVLVAQAA